MSEDIFRPIDPVSKCPRVFLLFKLKELLVGNLISIVIKEHMLVMRNLNMQRLLFVEFKGRLIIPVDGILRSIRKNRCDSCHFDVDASIWGHQVFKFSKFEKVSVNERDVVMKNGRRISKN